MSTCPETLLKVPGPGLLGQGQLRSERRGLLAAPRLLGGHLGPDLRELLCQQPAALLHHLVAGRLSQARAKQSLNIPGHRRFCADICSIYMITDSR